MIITPVISSPATVDYPPNPNFGYSHPLKTEWKNLVLASNKINNARGDKPLEQFLDLKAMARYLEQFVNIKVKGFDGNKYIAMILETVGGLINVQKN